MTNIRTIVNEVLSQLGNSREAQQYLKQFSSVDSMRFAVIKIGGGILEQQLESLASALAFLYHLGLMPIVLHGAGPQLDRALAEAGIETRRHNGLRVTTDKVMAVARPVIYRANRNLVKALEDHGVRAQGIQHGVFGCDYLDQDGLGLVGDICEVELEAIRDAAQAGILPVISCLGESRSGQVMNINADIAARELIWAIRPHKIIFLTPTGGLLDESGRIISAISLNNDYEYLVGQPWIHSGMKLKLEQINELLSGLPASASVSMTSVEQLARELFTHRGAGTLLRAGEAVVEYRQLDDQIRADLEGLLEHSFQRHLLDGYFDDLPLDYVLMSESGGAAAIVLRGIDGLPYLDKFAVTPQAQGSGLGAAVWQHLVQLCPQLYWRSRITNPVTQWYFEQADSTIRRGGWVAFSHGITDFSQLERCSRDSLERVESWVEHHDAD
jgi:acetylglutamate kinase